MIKIKDYIFNENEILYIKEDNKKLMVFLKQYVDKKVYDFIDATFDDIVWNYDGCVNKNLSSAKEYIEVNNKIVKGDESKK